LKSRISDLKQKENKNKSNLRKNMLYRLKSREVNKKSRRKISRLKTISQEDEDYFLDNLEIQLLTKHNIKAAKQIFK
jgi:hypothetical protein